MVGVERGPRIEFTFDGQVVEAFEGETVAAALFAEQRTTLRRSVRSGAPRSVYCNMGICFDCLVRVDGRSVRACMTPVRAGLEVASA